MNKYVEGRDYMEMPGGGRLGGPVDNLALIAELQAEKAGLERIIMAQEVALTELREGMEAVGAGGVSLMGDAKDAEIARLLEALQWNAAALQSLCNGSISEASTATIESETKRFGEILDMADATLTQQEQV